MTMNRLEDLQHVIAGMDDAIKTEMDIPLVRHGTWFLDVTYDEDTYVVVGYGKPWKGFTLTKIAKRGDETPEVFVEDAQEAAAKAVEMLKEKR
jgi:hypothetical protein